MTLENNKKRLVEYEKLIAEGKNVKVMTVAAEEMREHIARKQATYDSQVKEEEPKKKRFSKK